MAEHEIIGWHHPLNGHKFEQTGRYGRTRESSMLQSRGCKESDKTLKLVCKESDKRLNNNLSKLLKLFKHLLLCT